MRALHGEPRARLRERSLCDIRQRRHQPVGYETAISAIPHVEAEFDAACRTQGIVSATV